MLTRSGIKAVLIGRGFKPISLVMADRNISNKELAALIGMHPTSVSKIKTRRRLTRIDEATLSALCKALNCQPGDLMVYEEDEPDREK